MKAEMIKAIVGIGLLGVICLGFSVVLAAMAISAPSIGMALGYGFSSLVEAVTVAYIAYHITIAIKEWF